MKSRILKASTLKELNACLDQVNLFRETWSASVRVTEARMVKVAALFEWSWGARRLLSAPALAEYECVAASAWAEYQRVKASAWAEYVRGTVFKEQAAEYERVTVLALAEFLRVKARTFARLYIQEGVA